MGQLQLFVDGMSCRRRVREVTARLRDIPGVETVSANPGDSTVRLTGSMRLEDVLTALTQPLERRGRREQRPGRDCG